MVAMTLGSQGPGTQLRFQGPLSLSPSRKREDPGNEVGWDDNFSRTCVRSRVLINCAQANIFDWSQIYVYVYIYIFKYLRGKKDATTFSRQACFVNRFTIGALLSVINRARELIFFQRNVYTYIYIYILIFLKEMYIHFYIYMYVYTFL